MKGRLSLLLMSFLYLSTFAQIDKKYNAIRPGDEIIKQQVEYKDPGRSGENVVWNFSRLKNINDEYKLVYKLPRLENDKLYIMGKDTLSKDLVEDNELITGREHGTMYYYRIKDNSLYLLGHENATTLLHYQEPIECFRFPMSYGSKITNSYSSKARYSNRLDFNTHGEVSVEGDAYGMILLPSGDTLRHVTRIKTTQTYLENDSLEANRFSLSVRS